MKEYTSIQAFIFKDQKEFFGGDQFENLQTKLDLDSSKSNHFEKFFYQGMNQTV